MAIDDRVMDYFSEMKNLSNKRSEFLTIANKASGEAEQLNKKLWEVRESIKKSRFQIQS